MFDGFDNFFIMAGTAAATLIGLLFVSITLGVGLSAPRGVYGTHARVTAGLASTPDMSLRCGERR